MVIYRNNEIQFNGMCIQLVDGDKIVIKMSKHSDRLYVVPKKLTVEEYVSAGAKGS